MVWMNLRLGAVLELAVILFQVAGVAALCMNRLMPATRWAARGRNGAVVAVVGLAIAGALCGRLASEFALFAGLTMTILLIGLTTGNSSSPDDSRGEARGRITAEPNLAG
jgi:uncharacterized membrane protein YhaH (DUF805 family)